MRGGCSLGKVYLVPQFFGLPLIYHVRYQNIKMAIAKGISLRMPQWHLKCSVFSFMSALLVLQLSHHYGFFSVVVLTEILNSQKYTLSRF